MAHRKPSYATIASPIRQMELKLSLVVAGKDRDARLYVCICMLTSWGVFSASKTTIQWPSQVEGRLLPSMVFAILFENA